MKQGIKNADELEKYLRGCSRVVPIGELPPIRANWKLQSAEAFIETTRIVVEGKAVPHWTALIGNR